MTLANQLRLARALIANPKHHTTAVYAADQYGFPVAPQEQAAVCWCAAGAAHRVDPDGKVGRALSDAAESMGFLSAVHLNDSADHETVLRMFDLAIASAEQPSQEVTDAALVTSATGGTSTPPVADHAEQVVSDRLTDASGGGR